MMMKVSVDNELKKEEKKEKEKLVLENKSIRDKLRSLEDKIEKIKE
jgi:hypothetical protein